MTVMAAVPRRVFYMWCGAEKPLDVRLCIFGWRQRLPDFELIELSERDSEWFDFKAELRRNDWFRAVYERKMWGFVADYVRFKVLYEHGGVWLDTDVSVIKDFSPLTGDGVFLGRENPRHVETAVIGAVKGHPLLKNILDFYDNEIWHAEIYTSPMLLTEALKRGWGLSGDMRGVVSLEDGIRIYPPEYFYPLALKGNEPELAPDSYAIHWWKASWNRAEIKYWLNHKHIWGRAKALKINPAAYKKVYLFGFIPCGRYEYEERRFSVCGIPLLRLKKTPRKELLMLFGCIPLLKLK